MTDARMHIMESELLQKGVYPISGTDEAGYGPLAGPVCVATVILNPHRMPEGLRDSKKVGERARERLYEEIMEKAVAVSIAYASVAEIDAMNILAATKLAMMRSITTLTVKPAFAIVDGLHLPNGMPCEARAVVDGDDKSASCAAASIVAKRMQVAQAMAMHRCNPEYGFDRHKGYGTALHLSALAEHGPSPWHRSKFTPVRRAARLFASKSEGRAA